MRLSGLIGPKCLISNFFTLGKVGSWAKIGEVKLYPQLKYKVINICCKIITQDLKISEGNQHSLTLYYFSDHWELTIVYIIIFLLLVIPKINK